MKQLSDVALSVLDLATIRRGGDASEAFARTAALARHAEALGYTRYWLAEHHNLAGVASSATSVLIGYVASLTQRIRVGSGGVMLPNHAPLIIAEQFGTLASLYPGRIDLGLGRAPGTDGLTARALRRHLSADENEMAELLAELRGYFKPERAGEHVRAIPGEGLDVPVWLLGSGAYSAQLAGTLGLPFGFASHFAPDNVLPALDLYRRSFRPSATLQQPYVQVGMNVVAADTLAHAEYLATSLKQRWLRVIRDQRGPLDPPVDSMHGLWNEREEVLVNARLAATAIGDVATVRAKMQSFVDQTQADEIIICTDTFEAADRLRSFELVMQARG
ncbi:luciferase family oxidoreductase, group 1 [Andreprevotia lacus DSM 23236]|jgi:luciferase family oxidoreductase group 1|uniref:Luciferase-like monooxygenase n=1 Tax=Andreprevotia lacus DSM 23236 TaxID=1121001 RepID=A0A1W1XVN1_9NEIS|nr:LLM class flavin-dependent oxidoreductase [Andreprevotia lacus]SMC27937.1 luciferase family oxidoreductase, group 1 [Andreprevotia lacus DSM 23236]